MEAHFYTDGVLSGFFPARARRVSASGGQDGAASVRDEIIDWSVLLKNR